MRLIGADNKQIGVVTIREALNLAEEAGLDLVEVAPTANPPVCKIMDFGKYRFQQQMKERESKKKQHVIKIKEVRFRPNIGDHDLQMKINAARKFLKDGFKVKITLLFRGREMAHQETGVELVKRILEQLSDVGVPEKNPLMEGRTIITYLIAK